MHLHETQSNKETTDALIYKNQSQDDATNQLRMNAEQTQLELQQMRLELQTKEKPNQLYRLTTCSISIRHVLSTRPWLPYLEAGDLEVQCCRLCC